MLRSINRLSVSASNAVLSRRGFAVEVSAAMVKKLRELSGAPLMDCKHALGHETVQGDLQKAMDWLRAKGISKVTASKRETKEGLIGVHTQGDNVTLVEVNCETDFVSMNQDFQRFVASVSESVAQHYANNTSIANIAAAEILALKLVDKPSATVEQGLGDIVASIRETIVIKRAAKFAAPSPNGVLASYVHGKVGGSILPSHIQLGKATGVVHIAVDGVNAAATQQTLKDSVGRKLAMHVVAAKPLYLSSQEVPADFIEKEVAIFREQSKDDVGKKKPEVVEKIIQGKVNKRLSEVCLLGQNHMAEEGNPVVKKFLDTFATSQNAKVEVKEFTLWNLNQA